MTLSEFQGVLKKADFSGFFVFAGEERYLAQAYLKMVRDKLLTEPDFNTFNHIVREGPEPDFGSILQDIQTPPFFAEYKLIEWHSSLLTSFSAELEKGFEEIENALQNNPNCTVVFINQPDTLDIGTDKRPTDAYKKISKYAQIVRFDKSTDGQLLNWMNRHFTHDGIQATPAICKLILSRVGHSMTVLASEIDKLTCYVKANNRNVITEDDVFFVCTFNIEEDDFALRSALINDQKDRVFLTILDLKNRRVDPNVILGSIYKFYSEALMVSCLLSEGLSKTAIASKTGLKEYPVSTYMDYCRRHSTKAIALCLSACKDVDQTVKSNYTGNNFQQIDLLLSKTLNLY